MTERTRAVPPSKGGASAIESSRQSHDLLARAQAHLYEVLAAAQVGRERGWASQVVTALTAAARAIESHATEVRAPTGLYAEVQAQAPWLTRRLEHLQHQLERVRGQTEDLIQTVIAVEEGALSEAQGVRAEVERLLSSVRDLVTQENELVYECWLDTPALD